MLATRGMIRACRPACNLLIGLIACTATSLSAAPLHVTGIAALYHDGQTFITWKEVPPTTAESIRYALYQANQPITNQNIHSAHLLQWDIPSDAASVFGPNVWSRVPRAVIATGQSPLPNSVGLAVVTATEARRSYYAIVATDRSDHPLSEVVPGESATVQPTTEAPAPIQPIKVASDEDQDRGTSPRPLVLWLHGHGGRESERGDAYLYMGTDEMGYRDGIPGVFTVQQRGSPENGRWFEIRPRDLIRNPDGDRPLSTYWFGYEAEPQWSDRPARFAYPFTEQRLLWMLAWVSGHYPVDSERVYGFGESMGGWGMMTFALRHPEVFSAIYPMMPRMRQTMLASTVRRQPTVEKRSAARALLPDGRTNYFDRMDMVKFVAEHSGDLPFIGWSIGRHDGFATWREQVDMVHALEATHRGFAFAWNDGGHGAGTKPMQEVLRFYPMSRFALNLSYPAFSRSSLDSDPGDGDLQDGDKDGGINLGFAWSSVVDQADRWVVSISNALNHASMTVDITPRRAQQFRLVPGDTVRWTTSTGASGSATADRSGLVTVQRIVIQQDRPTQVILTK